MEALRPGDVVVVRRRGGRVAVLSHEHRRGGGSRLVAVTPGRDVVRLGPQDFDGPPRRAATIDLPTPFAPRNPTFRRQTAERLRRVKLHDDGGRSRKEERRQAALEQAIAEHPLTRDPQREAKLRAGSAIERFERDVTRTERRVRGRSESLARQFDRVLRILEAWGYVDGWALTEAGDHLARLYTETDLLLAEALREGLLDGLSVPELAAVVSCFTYERRGPEGQHPVPPARWPTKAVAKRARAVERIANDLRANEDDAGLPETRSPDPGFTPYAYDWATGDTLAEVLDDDEMTGGDFVRHVKQCIDLLRQVGDVASDAETRDRARAAADACHRGVVAASSVASA
jgi:ATP-dependent RNA helicase HelY